MAQARTPLRSPAARRKPPVFSRTVIAVIAVYCVMLAAGLLFYRSFAISSIWTKAASDSKSEQIGHITIVTGDGCRSGEFDNSKPAEVNLSRHPCDETLGSIEPDQGLPQSGNARIKAIGRYFRGGQ
jgi:hypothetical protein